MSDLSPCWYWEGGIPSEICDYIVNSIDKNNYRRGLLFNNQEPGEVRKVNIQFTDINWINALLNGYIRFANHTNFHFDLSEEDKEPTQYLVMVKENIIHFIQIFLVIGIVKVIQEN